MSKFKAQMSNQIQSSNVKCFGFWILVIFLTFGFLHLDLESATIDELKENIALRESQIQAIEREIAEYQKELDETSGEAKTLKAEIVRLESLLKKLNADLRLTQRKLGAANLQIQKLNLEIGETSSEIAAKRRSLAGLVRAVWESESKSLVEVMLEHAELSDFFAELESIQNVEKATQIELNLLKELKIELEEREAEEEKTKSRLEDLTQELKDRALLQDAARQNKNELLRFTKNKEAEYQKLLRERELKRAEIVEDIRKIEDNLRLLVDPSTLPAPRAGVLAWPVASVKVTQNFGETSFAKNTDVYGNKTHNGIDLRASVGTPILAADDGVVKSTGNSDNICPGGSYGRWVLIEHPSRLTTLYAHLSLVRASAGQEVKRGQIIGYSGDSGYTTGPHLHFTVYDARTVELRKSRVCGVLPYGGYLNPMIYL